jgi:hypothetical protein
MNWNGRERRERPVPREQWHDSTLKLDLIDSLYSLSAKEFTLRTDISGNQPEILERSLDIIWRIVFLIHCTDVPGHRFFKIDEFHLQSSNLHPYGRRKRVQARPHLFQSIGTPQLEFRGVCCDIAIANCLTSQSFVEPVSVKAKDVHTGRETKIEPTLLPTVLIFMKFAVEIDLRHRRTIGEPGAAVQDAGASKREDCRDQRLPISERKALRVDADRSNQNNGKYQKANSQQIIFTDHIRAHPNFHIQSRVAA